MLKKFEGFDYEKAREKFFDLNEELTVEEISGLFGLIEAKEDRLKAIEELVKGRKL